MKVTTRDLFNYVNPARRYGPFLKENKLQDGDLDPGLVPEVLEAKQQGTLPGEQVKHQRKQDEVDCGD